MLKVLNQAKATKIKNLCFSKVWVEASFHLGRPLWEGSSCLPPIVWPEPSKRPCFFVWLPWQWGCSQAGVVPVASLLCYHPRVDTHVHSISLLLRARCKVYKVVNIHQLHQSMRTCLGRRVWFFAIAKSGHSKILSWNTETDLPRRFQQHPQPTMW